MSKNRTYYLSSLSGSSIATLSVPALANAACEDGSGGVKGGAACATEGTGLESSPNVGAQIKDITNLLLFGVGIAAVVMLIIGGFRYIFSSGDPAQTKSAKDTILYAIVGVVIAILAYAIVNFVLSRF